MNKFRLKKEATPFFKDKLASEINDFDVWTKHYNVDENALEEVEDVVIVRGHKFDDGNGSSLGGWDSKNGTELKFTIYFPSLSFYENDKFTKGRSVRELMDRLQAAANAYMLNFLDPKEND